MSYWLCIEQCGDFDLSECSDPENFEDKMGDLLLWLLNHPKIAESFYEHYLKVRSLCETNN